MILGENKKILIVLFALNFLSLSASCQNDIAQRLFQDIKYNDMQRFESDLQHVENVDITDVNGFSLLNYAVLSKNHKAVEILLKKFPNLDLKSKDKFFRFSALNTAASNNDDKLVKLLLETKGTIVNTTDYAGSTPMHYAVKYASIPLVTVLLEHDANVLTKDKYGQTPLDQTRSLIGSETSSLKQSNLKKIEKLLMDAELNRRIAEIVERRKV